MTEAKQPRSPAAQALGSYIRAHRRLAHLSLREMAKLTQVSNAYLSQVERGLHLPSVRVLIAIGRALSIPADMLLAEAGLLGRDRDDDARTDSLATARPGELTPQPSTEAVILADPRLNDDQRQALLGVYHSFVGK